jgi:diaminopimelate decarboxylase
MAPPWLRAIKRRLTGASADGHHAAPAPLPENRPPETAFPWHEVITEALRTWRTPFYINAWLPVREALEGLAPLSQLGVPVRHWLSVKTQPVKPLLVAWGRQLGLGAEVISPFELHAVRSAGFAASDILLNGVAKHAWLPADIQGLRLHLDSLTEAKTIGPERLKGHRLGARCFIESGHSADDPTVGGQFGMLGAELQETSDFLRRHGLALEGLHFHLRSSITDADTYAAALERTLAMGQAVGIAPRYVDCGGGFPSPGEAIWDGHRWLPDQLSLPDLVSKLAPIVRRHPSIAEVWFENGRHLTSRSGVLVLKVLEIKERLGCRFVLCDGGRTNHALVSDWQYHAIETLPRRSGPHTPTIVCGPTCTAYDRLTRRPLPEDLSVGDYLIWFNAGAYHLSWETRFSHGLATVLWCDEQMRLSEARTAEDAAAWWGSWA